MGNTQHKTSARTSNMAALHHTAPQGPTAIDPDTSPNTTAQAPTTRQHPDGCGDQSRVHQSRNQIVQRMQTIPPSRVYIRFVLRSRNRNITTSDAYNDTNSTISTRHNTVANPKEAGPKNMDKIQDHLKTHLHCGHSVQDTQTTSRELVPDTHSATTRSILGPRVRISHSLTRKGK